MKRLLTSTLLLATVTMAMPMMAIAAPANQAPQRKADLADRVAGTYEGAVTSDSRGSSRNNITIVVKKIGRNMVEVSCDYARIPTTRIQLEQAGNAILSATSGVTFLVELTRDANRLDLYIDGAALIVRRAG